MVLCRWVECNQLIAELILLEKTFNAKTKELSVIPPECRNVVLEIFMMILRSHYIKRIQILLHKALECQRAESGFNMIQIRVSLSGVSPNSIWEGISNLRYLGDQSACHGFGQVKYLVSSWDI
jgi:hypothetical protein